MKYFLLLTSFLFFSTYSNAQWKTLNPYPTANTTYVGSAPSADRFITVTGQDEAIVTHDGGDTWDVVQIGGGGIYRAAFFINDNIGWAVGSFVERLHKTTDGGLTWTHLPNAPDTTKYNVYFVDENTGWSVGYNGFIIKTTDGGSSWFSQSNTSITSSTLYGVCATDINNVFIAGNANSLVRSADGGNTWSLYPQIFSSSTDYRDVCFPPAASGLTGYLVGSSERIARTTDGGVTWSPVYDGGTEQLWSVSFNNINTVGIACGAGGMVLRTTDGGDTWNVIPGFPDETFYSVRFGSDNVVYLDGHNGYIYKSTDAGITWNQSGYRFTTTSLNDVCFSDLLNGYVVGMNGFIARSTDGGNTFTPQSSTFTNEINEVTSPSPDAAVAGCDDGIVLWTSDGGSNWTEVNTGFGTSGDILAIDFINNSTGWAAGYNGIVAKSTDGGASWTNISNIPSGSPWDMDFVDDLYGWIVCTGERIYATTDGGLTWNQQYYGGGLGTYGVSFADRSHGVAGGTGGNTYYTTNGGAAWNAASVPPDHSVWGIEMKDSPNGLVAFAACASGYAYKSTDGGITWIQQQRYTINTFDDVSMSDAGHAWFAGNYGLLIGYYDPSAVPVELLSFTAGLINNKVELNWKTATEKNNRGFEIERQNVKTTGQKGTAGWEKIGFVEGNGTTVQTHSYSFSDNNPAAGNYSYRLKQIDFDGSYEYSDVVGVTVNTVLKYNLSQNYPNPFNPATQISYSIPSAGFVTLKVYDVLGNEVAVLVNEEKPAGVYTLNFNARSVDGQELSSGVYLYRLKAGDYSSTKKLILMK